MWLAQTAGALLLAKNFHSTIIRTKASLLIDVTTIPSITRGPRRCPAAFSWGIISHWSISEVNQREVGQPVRVDLKTSVARGFLDGAGLVERDICGSVSRTPFGEPLAIDAALIAAGSDARSPSVWPCTALEVVRLEVIPQAFRLVRHVLIVHQSLMVVKGLK